jgi:hypothetical protein
MTKTIIFLGIFLIIILSLNFKIVDHGLLWTKCVSMYGMYTNEKVERFIHMHCDISLLPSPLQMHNNINTHVHVKKKNNVCRFHYPFSQQYLHTQVKNIFQSLKDLKENENISF